MMLGIVNGIKRLTAFTALLLLADCGFRLAGTGALPAAMQATYLDCIEPRSEFCASLRETLRRRDLELVDSRADAGAVLRISEDSTGQRVLSVSARNIPREYEVFYSVSFSLQADGRSLIASEPLLVRRNYTYDETQVLGKEREEDKLRHSLAEDLARQVMRRIEAVSAAGNPAPA